MARAKCEAHHRARRAHCEPGSWLRNSITAQCLWCLWIEDLGGEKKEASRAKPPVAANACTRQMSEVRKAPEAKRDWRTQNASLPDGSEQTRVLLRRSRNQLTLTDSFTRPSPDKQTPSQHIDTHKRTMCCKVVLYGVRVYVQRMVFASLTRAIVYTAELFSEVILLLWLDSISVGCILCVCVFVCLFIHLLSFLCCTQHTSATSR